MKSILLSSSFALLLASTCAAMEMPKKKRACRQLASLDDFKLSDSDKIKLLKELVQEVNQMGDTTDLDAQTDALEKQLALNTNNTQETLSSPIKAFELLKTELVQINTEQKDSIEKNASLAAWYMKLNALKKDAQISNMKLFQRIKKFEEKMQPSSFEKDISKKSALNK